MSDLEGQFEGNPVPIEETTESTTFLSKQKVQDCWSTAKVKAKEWGVKTKEAVTVAATKTKKATQAAVTKIKSLDKPTLKQWIWVPILLLLLLIYVIYFRFQHYVKPHIGDYILEGTDFVTDEVNFLGVEYGKSAKFEFIGVETNNFTNIEEPTPRHYFKAGGFFLREMRLEVKSVNLLYYNDEDDKYEKLGKMSATPFTVGTIDKQFTDLDFNVTVIPDSAKLFGTIGRILGDPDAQLAVQGHAQVKVTTLFGFYSKEVNVPVNMVVDKPKLWLRVQDGLNML